MTGQDKQKPRRKPRQKRSKARLDAIHKATEQLICERGVVQLTTRSIAERAGIPIGSFYQYFADREAIVRSLVDGYHEQIRKSLLVCFEGVYSKRDFEKALIKSTRMFTTFFEENTAFQELWFGAQQWQPLREMDIQDTLLNASILYDALLPLAKGVASAKLRAACIVYCDITGSLTRLALHLDSKDQKRILTALNDLLVTHIRTVFD